jgi:hypothetical protein
MTMEMMTMLQVVEPARLAREKGLQALTSEQRRLLLLAGQADFFEKLLNAAEK